MADRTSAGSHPPAEDRPGSDGGVNVGSKLTLFRRLKLDPSRIASIGLRPGWARS